MLPPALSSHARPRLCPQVSVPPGALDCWVFLSCLEVLQRIEGCCDRAQIDSNIAHTVGLWSYATEKVTAPVPMWASAGALPAGLGNGVSCLEKCCSPGPCTGSSGYFRVRLGAAWMQSFPASIAVSGRHQVLAALELKAGFCSRNGWGDKAG